MESISDKVTRSKEGHESLTRESTALLGRRIADLDYRMVELSSALFTFFHGLKPLNSVRTDTENSSNVDDFCNRLKEGDHKQ